MKKIDKEKVKEYFNKTNFMYKFFWSPLYMHYGLWYEDTQDLKAALENTNKFVAEKLQVEENDKILDAGCGLGGSSFYLAENFNTKVTGITISEKQIENIKIKKKENGLENLTEFRNMDFSNTEFQNSSFTKIFGIESICHAPEKEDFLKEAYRLLKEGGKIVVVDGFLARTNLTKTEEKFLNGFLEGWTVPYLPTVHCFREILEETGFQNITYYDMFEYVKKSSKRISIMANIAYPLSLLLRSCRIISEKLYGNTVACRDQKKLVDRDVVTYGAFVAEK